MKRNRQDVKMLAIGLCLSAAASLGAWSVGRDDGTGVTTAAALETMNAAAGGTAVSWDLPVAKNDQVDRFIGYLTGKNKDRTKLWLERSGTYVPMIEQKLRAKGMPEDLIYLAFIESGYSPNAYSRAKAAGLWQFIEETGERWGLEVSKYVDERRDPVKATDAALGFLQNLHDRFGSWYLAAAAYNTGPNRVERILREHAGGAKGDEDLYWAIAPYLPRETRDYVPLMLAAGHIGKEPGRYGFTDLNYHAPLSYATVKIHGGTSLATIARAAGVEESAIKELNPQLIRGQTPPNRTYEVRVPESTDVVAFTMNLERVKADAARKAKLAAASMKKHTIRRGESLSVIAKRYHTTVAKIQNANGNVNPRRLIPGKVLRIPA